MRIVNSEQGSSAAPFSKPIAGASQQIRKLSVLMPVYNECWTLREIVSRVLASRVGVAIELIIVDDASSDGSWDVIQDLAAKDSRIKIVRHEKNRGKGAAIRTAIPLITGEVSIIQDADLEYDPQEYSLLLAPILAGKADAVFGSRFAGTPRRVLFFWHSLANKFLTLVSNMANDLNLTDMESGYKIVRSSILKRLRLSAETFTFEPELTCRLAQWGARIYEVPISYVGRTYEEGKKIRAIDGVKAIWQILRCKFFDPQFTDHAGFYTLKSMSRSNRYNRWTLDLVKPFLGSRVLEAGSGLGNISAMLVSRERLILTDNDPIYLPVLEQRFGRRSNVRVDQGDLRAGRRLRPLGAGGSRHRFLFQRAGTSGTRHRRVAQLPANALCRRTLHHRGAGRQSAVHAARRSTGALSALHAARAGAKNDDGRIQDRAQSTIQPVGNNQLGRGRACSAPPSP